MHRYNINNKKLVIIPLDGTVFDLNRYRYNYYHHLCDDKQIPISKKQFYDSLSNMYDMYKTLPLANKVDTGPLNAKIERELSQYLSNKGIKLKDGFKELIEYLHQKDIKVAIISTHRTKDAVQYLQQARVYNKVQFIIGSDTTSLPLPSTQILETIAQYFEIRNEETLVISSFMSLNYAANQLRMGVIYCEDLVKADIEERQTSYKIVSNLFEVLNIFLFDKYDDVEMFSPILGMNDQMSKEELDEVHDQLQKRYNGDSQIMELVTQTYEYHLSQFNLEEEKKPSSLKKQYFSFDNNTDEKNVTEVNRLQEMSIEETEEKSGEDITQENSKTHLSSLTNQEDEELTTILQHINRAKEPQVPQIKTVTDYNEIEQIVKDSQEDNDTNQSLFLSFLVNIVYIFAISFLIVFIGIIIYIAFIHQFETNDGLFSVLTSLFHFYYSIIEGFFSIIFNSLHALISAIPNYQQYETANIFFSVDGVRLSNIFFFQSLFIGIIKIIVYLFRKDNNDESIS